MRWSVVLASSLALTAFALVLDRSLSAAKPVGISPSRAQLVSAIGPVRLLKGRLSGLEYLPMEYRREFFQGEFSGFSERLPQIDPTKAREIASFAIRVQNDYKRDPSPQTLGDQALLVFLQQRPDRLESALSLLESAVEEAPRDASLWSDLAAGYLASTRPEPPNSCLALAAAGRAVQEDPMLREARFNLALALENCSLFRQARRAWEEYLHLDPTSGWAKEARKHLRSLLGSQLPLENWNRRWKGEYELSNPDQSMLYPSVTQIAREDVLEDILGAWAFLLSKGHPSEAKLELDTAQRISRLVPVYRPRALMARYFVSQVKPAASGVLAMTLTAVAAAVREARSQASAVAGYRTAEDRGDADDRSAGRSSGPPGSELRSSFGYRRTTCG